MTDDPWALCHLDDSFDASVLGVKGAQIQWFEDRDGLIAFLLEDFVDLLADVGELEEDQTEQARERFTLLVEQYKAAPEVTRKRLWLETVQRVLADNRKVVGGDGRQLIYVPMAGATQVQPALPAQAILPDLVSPTVEATADPARPGRQGRSAGREENVR